MEFKHAFGAQTKTRQRIRQQTFGCSTPCFVGKPEVIVSQNFLASDWLLN
jgi:hypothetical protein